MPSCFVSLFSFNWFNSSTIFAASLIVEFIFRWLLSWLLTIFINWSSIYFVLKCSALFIICALYVTSICYRPLPPPSLFTYNLSISAFGWFILYTVSTFLVFLSIFLISSNLQLILPKLYLNTGTTNASVALILFLAFNWDFSGVFLLKSFFNLLIYALTLFYPSVFVCFPLFELYFSVEIKYQILWVN